MNYASSYTQRTEHNSRCPTTTLLLSEKCLRDALMPTELEIAPAPTAEELRVIKAVADLVDGRGAIPDVGPNGRYSWLSLRATSDLKTYISQPAHAGLCAGAREVTEFYINSLKPLQKRASDVGDLVKLARTLAAKRVADASAPAATLRADDATATLITLTADAVQSILSADDTTTIRAERNPLAALQRAKPMLILAQVEAAKDETAERRDRIHSAGRAMRMLEAAAYTEIYQNRYRAFAATVLSLPTAIRTEHATACTCGN